MICKICKKYGSKEKCAKIKMIARKKMKHAKYL